MKRNLESRVEVVTPVEDKGLQERLREILDVQIKNRRSVWDMQPDGTYVKRQPGEHDDSRTVQEILIDLAERRLAVSSPVKKHKQKKSRKGRSRKRN